MDVLTGKRRVSVVVPTRNRPDTLRQALASIRALEADDLSFEILVGDNGDDPGTPAVCAEFGAAHLPVKEQGAAAARNAGLFAATGEFIAFLDDDDVWKDNHVRPHLAVFDARPEIEAVMARVMAVDEDLREVAGPWPWKMCGEGDESVRNMLSGYYPQIGATIVRASLREAIGGFDLALLGDQDWDWQLRIARRRTTAFIPDPCVLFRQRAPASHDELRLRRLGFTRKVFLRHAWPERRLWPSMRAWLDSYRDALWQYFGYFEEAAVMRAGRGQAKGVLRAAYGALRVFPFRAAAHLMSPKPLGRAVRGVIIGKFITPLPAKQGVHIDPAERGPLDMSDWTPEEIALWNSEEMQVFRDCLRYGELNERDSVLDDLAAYHNISREEARAKCLHWEEWSVREWQSADRSTPEGVQSFYDTVESWAFDLLWHAYQQSAGYGRPASVMAAQLARAHFPNGDHLDFGSGVGITSQLFAKLGLRSTMADVCKPLLKFGRWRMERRGGPEVAQINLAAEKLPADAYDIITALDALVHVTDLDAVAADLHRALRPNGLLVANFDVRQKGSAESAWHLHHDAIALETRLERAGFVKVEMLGGTHPVWRRVERKGIAYTAHLARSTVSLPIRSAVALGRRIRWPIRRRETA